jgi:CDP-diacylglycerol--glycerol-3-phosphate 3-phosphatidyltransferase
MSLIPRFVRRGFEAILSPLVNRLVAWRVSPNAITTVGTLVLVGSAVAFGVGEARLGGFLLLLSGVCDMLDGRVARKAGGVTKYGAFYDSTLDRVGDAALFTGILLYFVAGGVPQPWVVPGAAVAAVALGATLIVSYARARAEGLELECKVGIAQRAERVLGLGVPTLFFGAGPNGYMLLGIVAVLAVLALVTVVQRMVHVRKITRRKTRATQSRWQAPAFADMSSEKGPGGD